MPNRRKELKIEGANLWYLVGLITSDGCLSSDGRHIDVTSKDETFLYSIKEYYGLGNRVSVKYNSIGQKAFRIQIANRNFYDFLLSIGLTPNKSLSLERIKISEVYFLDFLRGLIDGDGGIQRWIHHTNKREQWSLRVASGSRKFLEWLESEIGRILSVKGKLYSESKSQFRLKYGKMTARIIAQKCYYEGAFGLERKKNLAKACISSYRGWHRSKTIGN